MAKTTSNKTIDNSTEEKIKAAAQKVFHQKGYAATRTRDIALEAGINLALLNYYFRSKQKLFNLIMEAALIKFMMSLKMVFNDEKTDLQTKVERICARYIDLLIKEPELPLFIMNELRHHPQFIADKIEPLDSLSNSVFATQFKEAVKKGSIRPTHMLHFIMNILGLAVFPFIAQPILKNIGKLNENQFKKLMMERKKLIPQWVKLMMNPT